MARLAEQLLDRMLRLCLVTLAEMVVANAALRVDEVMRRPILAVGTAPDRVAVVVRNRIVDAEALHGGTDIVDVPCSARTRTPARGPQ
jgi:hypothetical protein